MQNVVLILILVPIRNYNLLGLPVYNHRLIDPLLVLAWFSNKNGLKNAEVSNSLPSHTWTMGNATAQAINRGVVQVYTPEHLAAVVNERRFEARYKQLTDLPVIIVSDKDIKEEERKITKADLNNNYGITDVDLSFNQITKLQDLQQLVKAKR